MAAQYPDVRFAHCGGLWTAGKPKNIGSFFGYIDECEYLSGVVAAHASKTKKRASSPPNPFPRCCVTSIPLPWGPSRSPDLSPPT